MINKQLIINQQVINHNGLKLIIDHNALKLTIISRKVAPEGLP